MPDITISFTDAQWARIVAASASIKSVHDGGGDVDAAYLQDKLKAIVSSWVQGHEKEKVSVTAWD